MGLLSRDHSRGLALDCGCSSRRWPTFHCRVWRPANRIPWIGSDAAV